MFRGSAGNAILGRDVSRVGGIIGATGAYNAVGTTFTGTNVRSDRIGTLYRNVSGVS